MASSSSFKDSVFENPKRDDSKNEKSAGLLCAPIGAATYQQDRRKPSQSLAAGASRRQTLETVSWLPLHFRLFHFTYESCLSSDSVHGCSSF
ncbi:unnamed protein product [Callosobruchus maculatus]|uniref:Uncharacterized protein n=1 Tax=Callosobruchus maculatus TaxID=64391 RepID=A0A653DRV7_CALMS|nr:unnamed protein product [Callosobruchus maculatus]